MPHADPDKRREATRKAVKRHRAKAGTGLEVLEGDGGALPDPPSREHLLKALGVQAMEGNVPAIRLLLEEYRRDDGHSDVTEEQKSVILRLAERAS